MISISFGESFWNFVQSTTVSRRVLYKISRRFDNWQIINGRDFTRFEFKMSLGGISYITTAAWAPSQYPKRRLFVRTRKVSKPRDWYFKLSYRFDRHIGSTAAEVPVKFQSDRTILNTNLVASRLYEILRKDVFSDIETGPGYCSILQNAGLDGLTYWGLDKMADIFITVTS